MHFPVTLSHSFSMKLEQKSSTRKRRLMGKGGNDGRAHGSGGISGNIEIRNSLGSSLLIAWYLAEWR
jgi:hypothetical protein